MLADHFFARSFAEHLYNKIVWVIADDGVMANAVYQGTNYSVLLSSLQRIDLLKEMG